MNPTFLHTEFNSNKFPDWIAIHFNFYRSLLVTYRVCLDWVYFCWNWKYCSEIIFKRVNSAVGPILNKKVVKKCNLWDRKQCMDALFTVDKVNYCGWTKKEEEKNAVIKRRRGNNCNPNSHIVYCSSIFVHLFSFHFFFPFEVFCCT